MTYDSFSSGKLYYKLLSSQIHFLFPRSIYFHSEDMYSSKVCRGINLCSLLRKIRQLNIFFSFCNTNKQTNKKVWTFLLWSFMNWGVRVMGFSHVRRDLSGLRTTCVCKLTYRAYSWCMAWDNNGDLNATWWVPSAYSNAYFPQIQALTTETKWHLFSVLGAAGNLALSIILDLLASWGRTQKEGGGR